MSARVTRLTAAQNQANTVTTATKTTETAHKYHRYFICASFVFTVVRAYSLFIIFFANFFQVQILTATTTNTQKDLQKIESVR